VADYEAIIQGIRGLLRSGTDGPIDELADLAAAYAAFCRETNTRLRRCVQYARAGAVAEAAHLAGCQPPLDRVLPVLQFPEHRDWAALCARLRLPQGPAILADDVAEVRAAVAAEQRLRPLLARHRTLALALAPLRDRLRVARLLATHDPANPAWPTEVRRLETARLDELTSDGAAADGGEALAAELLDGTWLTPIPPEVWALAAPARRRRESDAAAREMAELAAGLTAQRLAAVGPAEGEAAATRWEALAAAHPAAVDPATAERVRAAVAEWREQEARRRSAEEAKMMSQMFGATGAAAAPAQQGGAGRRRWWPWRS